MVHLQTRERSVKPGRGQAGQRTVNAMTRRLLCILLAVIAAALAAFTAAPAHAAPAPGSPGSPDGLSTAAAGGELTYSELRTAISKRTVKAAELRPVQGLAALTMRDGKKAVAAYPITDQDLAKDLAAAGAQVTIANQANTPSPLTMLPMLLMLLMLIGGALFMFSRNRAGGAGGMGGMSGMGRLGGAGKAKAQVAEDKIPAERFADVAGVDEAVEGLRDLLGFLTEPERYAAVGAKLPRGVIFHGPPGTGKTLLAKALAGEAGVPFFAVSGSEFVEMIVGVGAARVRSLFAEARQHPAAVVFFDEFDALGKKRGGLNSNEEREQTLNQLLVEMDGFEANSRIICIAATNMVETLDPAVLRPGRFGEQILIDLPAEAGRLRILEVHARNKPLAEDVDLSRLARITYGSSGADLGDMLNRAAIKAAKDARTQITQADLEDGYLDAIAGPRKRNAVLADGEREVVAVHEAGHVLAAELCPTSEKAMRVSIQPRGRAGGMAVYGRTDRMLHTPQYLHEKLIGVLGGRAAEFVTSGIISSGAANDLQQANAMARQAVEELGFSARAGQLVSSQGGQQVRVSEQTAAVIDQEVRALVELAYQDAVRLLAAHRDELDRLAGALLSSEDLDRPEIVAVLAGVAETPRATPRRADAGPQTAPSPTTTHARVEYAPVRARRRRGERLRVRLAAMLLREPAGQAAYSSASSAPAE